MVRTVLSGGEYQRMTSYENVDSNMLVSRHRSKAMMPHREASHGSVGGQKHNDNNVVGSPIAVRLPASPPETHHGTLLAPKSSVLMYDRRGDSAAPRIPAATLAASFFSSSSSSSSSSSASASTSNSTSRSASPNDPAYINSLTNLLTCNTKAPDTIPSSGGRDQPSQTLEQAIAEGKEVSDATFDNDFKKLEAFALNLQRKQAIERHMSRGSTPTENGSSPSSQPIPDAIMSSTHLRDRKTARQPHVELADYTEQWGSMEPKSSSYERDVDEDHDLSEPYHPVSLLQQKRLSEQSDRRSLISVSLAPDPMTGAGRASEPPPQLNVVPRTDVFPLKQGKDQKELLAELATSKQAYDALSFQHTQLQQSLDALQERHRQQQHLLQQNSSGRAQARCLELEKKLEAEREQHRLTQMDSRKTFKLFQDAQRHAQHVSAQLAEARESFSAQLRDARAAYDGVVGQSAAQESSSTNQIDLLIKKCDALTETVHKLRAENEGIKEDLERTRSGVGPKSSTFSSPSKQDVGPGAEQPSATATPSHPHKSGNSANPDLSATSAAIANDKLRRTIMTLMATLGDASLPSMEKLMHMAAADFEKHIRASLFRFVTRRGRATISANATAKDPHKSHDTSRHSTFGSSMGSMNSASRQPGYVSMWSTGRPSNVGASSSPGRTSASGSTTSPRSSQQSEPSKNAAAVPSFPRKGTLFGSKPKVNSSSSTSRPAKPASIWEAATSAEMASKTAGIAASTPDVGSSADAGASQRTTSKPGASAKEAARRQTEKMNYYFKRQQRELAAKRQREAELVERMRQQQNKAQQDRQRREQGNDSEKHRGLNFEASDAGSSTSTPPPPPPPPRDGPGQTRAEVVQQSNRSPGGSDLGNWVCVTREDGSVYYYHRLTKTVRWNRPDDSLIGEIERQIGAHQRDIAHRQNQRIREMRDAEAVQARHEEEKDRVKAAANVSRRVSTWAGRKTLPQLLRSVHLLLPTLVPTQVGVATDGGGVKSVRRLYHAVLRRIHPDKLSRTNSAPVSIVDSLIAQEVVSLLTAKYNKFSNS